MKNVDHLASQTRAADLPVAAGRDAVRSTGRERVNFCDPEPRLELSARRVLEETMSVAYSDIGELFNDNGSLKPLEEMKPGARKAIAGLEVEELFEGQGEERVQVGYTRKVKLWNKVQALELLGKNLKLWLDGMEARIKNMTPEQCATRAAELIKPRRA